MAKKTLSELTAFAQANGMVLRDAILYYEYEESAGGGGGTASLCTSNTVAVSGSVPIGSLAVTFTTSDDFTGTINGVARAAGYSYVFNPTTGYLNPEIPYVITTGTIILDIYEG